MLAEMLPSVAEQTVPGTHHGDNLICLVEQVIPIVLENSCSYPATDPRCLLQLGAGVCAASDSSGKSNYNWVC